MSVFIGHSEYLFKIFDGWLAFVLTLTDLMLIFCVAGVDYICWNDKFWNIYSTRKKQGRDSVREKK